MLFSTKFAIRASDVVFGSDAHCVSDVSPYGKVGKHHITLRLWSNTSLCVALHHFDEADASLFTGDYYLVKYALVLARHSFLKDPPKDDYEEYAQKVIGRAYFIILNRIDELDGTNERFLKYYRENIE